MNKKANLLIKEKINKFTSPHWIINNTIMGDAVNKINVSVCIKIGLKLSSLREKGYYANHFRVR